MISQNEEKDGEDGSERGGVTYKTIAAGNLLTLGVLAAGSAVIYLFLPYLPTLLWAQLAAFSLRGSLMRMHSKRRMSGSDAAMTLLTRGVLVGSVLGGAAILGLGRDAVYVGRGAIRNAADSREALMNVAAEDWIPQGVRDKIEELRPMVLEKAEPYVSGLFSDECCEIKEDAVLEAAGALDGDFETVARQAVRFVNSKLKSSEDMVEEVGWLDDAKQAVKAKLEDDPGLKDAIKAVAIQALSGLKTSSGLLFGLLSSLVSTILSSISSVVNGILFLLAIFAQLRRPSDWIEEALEVIGCSREDKRTLSIVAETLVVAPVFRGTLSALVTFVLVLLSGAPCATTAAVVAFFTGIFPLIPAQLAILCQLLYLLICGSYATALVLFLAHAIAMSKVSSHFAHTLKDQLNLPSSVISLSYVLGVQRLGTKGYVLGPLVLALAVQILNVMVPETSSEGEEDNDDICSKQTEPSSGAIERTKTIDDDDDEGDEE